MKDLILPYKDFSRFNDGWRLRISKKPRNPEWLKKIYYPFAVIGFLLFFGLVAFIILSIKNGVRRRPYYKNPKKYKEVVKEGILFTTREYHEK